MSVFSQQAYKDTAELITFYNLPGGKERYDPRIKNPRFVYRNRTKLKTILYIIEQFKHSYKAEIKEAFLDKEDFGEDVGKIFKNFYERRYLDQFKARLGPNQNKSPLLPQDDQFLEETLQKPDTEQDQTLDQKRSEIKQEEKESQGRASETQPRIQVPRSQVQTPEIVKNLSSKGQIGLRRLIFRTPNFIRGFFQRAPTETIEIPVEAPLEAGKITQAGGITRAGGLVRGGGTAARGLISGGARAGGLTLRGGALLFETPAGWIILAIIIILILLIILTHLMDNTALLPPYEQKTFNDNTLSETGPNTASQLTLVKSGPTFVDNNSSFDYNIDVTYTGSGTADILITDHLPQNLGFNSATEGGSFSDGVVSWQLSALPANQTRRLSVTVSPNQTDFYAVNNAEATVTNKSSNSLGGNQSNDFITLVQNQGRNTAILGSNENDFINRVINNAQGTNLSSLVGRQDQLRMIYQFSVADNVNPLVVLTIWGVEAGFSLNSTEFGCQPFGSGFENQLNCSANTLNYWMNYFDKNNQNGSISLTSSCTYTDSLVFAYEKYTPVCSLNDGNDNARTNFVKFYNILSR